MAEDLSIRILGEIRDAVVQTNGRLDQTNERLDLTNERLGQLERRTVETEIRLASELVAITSAVKDLKDVLLEDRRMRQQVEDHERRLQKLERRPG